jgi:hypothetical protein
MPGKLRAAKLWCTLGPYLDEALDLPPAQREHWLCLVARIQPDLVGLLRELLAESDVLREQGYLETPIVFKLPTL